MDLDLLRTLGQIAAPAGIAIGAFLYIARDVIAKNIFPTLTRGHAYNIIIVLAFMAWSVALAGIASWTYVSIHSTPSLDNGLSANEVFHLPSRTLIKLESPTDGQIVRRNVDVIALTENLPSEDDRWILVYAPSESKWYPTEVLEREDRFTTTVIVGAIGSYGKSYKIALFVTNSIGSQVLRGSHGNGVLTLPAGELREVIVKREPEGA